MYNYTERHDSQDIIGKGLIMKKATKDVVEVIGAFVAAYFFYHVLIAVTGTSLPLVSVVSGSMYHQDRFDAWWQGQENIYSGFGITKEQFLASGQPSGLSVGDLIFAVHDPNPHVGDIIIFQKPGSAESIIHRVVKINDDGTLQTKGDNNNGQLGFETGIKKEQLLGRAVAVIPIMGYPRLVLFWLGI